MEKSNQVRKWKGEERIKGRSRIFKGGGYVTTGATWAQFVEFSPLSEKRRCFLDLFCVRRGHLTQTIYFVLCEVGSTHTDGLFLFRVKWGHLTQTIYFVWCEVGSPHTDDLFCSVWVGITSHRRKYLSYFCIIFLSLFPQFKRWWKQISHLLFYQTHNLLHITHIVSPRVYKWVSYRFVPQVDLEDTF